MRLEVNIMRTADVWDAWSRNNNIIYTNEHSMSRSESHGAWARRFIFILCYQSVVKMKLKIIPIHHHFELLGWSETQVKERFWIVGVLSGMLGVALALWNG